jgi:large subunit ribosomal protein L15
MNLADVKKLGLTYPDRIRVGRGIGSGRGKTSGRGHKGAKARSGWHDRLGQEGGQMPLFRRIPKRGFNNKNFKKVFTIVNVSVLGEAFADGAVVDLAAVLSIGLVSKEKHTELFKVLGDGELKKKLTVRADAVTASARQKIESAGGKVEILPSVVYRGKFERKPQNTRLHRRVHEKRELAAKKAGAAAPGAATKPAAPKADDGAGKRKK